MSSSLAESVTMHAMDASQRHLDKLSGFAYLESFEELKQWREQDVDPLAVSNTPLLDRQESAPMDKTSKVMLIHDYKGGYNPYEACQGTDIDQDMYSCEYLQYVETFVYFSHKMVTVPTPTWINTCHRNGVPCLGTFIVEPGTKEVESILEADDLGSSWVAHQLALMAEKYGFDGWLVNIEESFPLLSWSIDRMEGFLRQLRRELGSRPRVVWYDALTTLNFVWYQNTLNSLNLTFARAAGSILTNYAWNPQLAKSGKNLAEKSELGVENVYFGIDVWAQNFQTGRNRRVTYPVKGGGGTGTGLGLQSLKELGLGAGIFAPGWSFEHFPKDRRAVDRSVWLRDELPIDVTCECYPETPHELGPYTQNGIIKHARRYCSGSQAFFHTDFRQAITPASGTRLFADIGSQSVLPLPSTAALTPTSKDGGWISGNVCAGKVSTELHRKRLVVMAHSTPQQLAPRDQVAAILSLFDLMISRNEGYELEVSYSIPEQHECTLNIIVRREGKHDHRITLLKGDTLSRTTLQPRGGPITGISLEILCESARKLPKGKLALLELFQITVRPSGSVSSCGLGGMRLEQRGEQDTKHHRLVWTVNGPPTEQAKSSPSMPVSSITGPCAYFVIHIDGQYAGKAFALEFVIPRCLEEKGERQGSVEVQITAIGFDGRTLADNSEVLRWPTMEEDDWIWVTHKDGGHDEPAITRGSQ